MTSLTWASAGTWWVPLKISQLMGHKSLLCHTMLHGMPSDDQATALQLCLFSRKGGLGSAAWRDTVPLMVHGWVFFSKWKQWEVAWKNYPPSTIYACISCSQHPCGVNLSQPEILPWWNQNQVHKTISVSYSVVLYYIYSICKCIWSNFETNLCQTEQNIGV